MTQEMIIALLTLVVLEVVLGIDNIIFISILADKLPESQRPKLRYWGIGLAVLMRLGLLTAISWIMSLTQEFDLFGIKLTYKGLILILGGLFLIYKATKEIYEKTENANKPADAPNKIHTFGSLLAQVLILDLVFSVDSIITAVGMVSDVKVMYAAVIISVLIMLFAATPISNFISKHPSFKILALAFLLVIGVSLIAEGFGAKIPKGYIYSAMAFSFFVDVLQMKTVKKP